MANLAYNTSSLVAYYFAGDLSNEVAITLATATLGTWTSGGFVAVDNTNMPGWYEIGIPDAALDGGNECAIQLRGAANMVPVNIHIELDAFDYQTATQPVNVTQFGGTNGTFTSGKPTVELDSAGQAMVTAFNAMRSGNVFTAPALANAPGGGGSGTGARMVTITVNDGTTVLQNATIRMTEGANTFTALTNASGVAVFNLDDATYTVAITKSGYSYAGTTIIVNGTETATYSMTANSVTPPTNPDLSAIEVLCLDEDFEAASGIDVDFRMASVASGDQNRAHPGAKKTVTSNGSGIARFEGPQGATIEWKRGTGQVWTSVTLDNDSVTNVTSVIGSP